MTKKRLLYISSIVPDTSCGAHIAIYRHFVVRNDFEIAVCGFVTETALTANKFTIVRHKLLKRFFISRFSRVAYNLEYIINWFRLPESLFKYAKEFKPDAIVTVPDNLHAGLAFLLAKKLDVPLISNFQDLFPISHFIPKFMEPYFWVRKFLLHKFQFIHRQSDIAFYTSEGMQAFFGKHLNGHILYPVGDFKIAENGKLTGVTTSPSPVKIIYAGNCYGAYGRMLLRFAREVKDSDSVKLKIFPVGKGWSQSEIDEMTTAGIYQNFLPFDKLKIELQKADAFLTVMSFEAQEEPFVRTSFTTKWLDYAPFGKPIFVWGPVYSSAVLFAQKYDSGIFVTENDASKLNEAIIHTAKDTRPWQTYSSNAKAASEKILNPNVIHSLFVREINKITNSMLQSN